MDSRVKVTVCGSDVALEELADWVERGGATEDVRVSRIITGDLVATMTILASAVTIIDVFLRWVREPDKGVSEHVSIKLPNGELVEVGKDNLEEVERLIRQIASIPNDENRAV